MLNVRLLVGKLQTCVVGLLTGCPEFAVKIARPESDVLVCFCFYLG